MTATPDSQVAPRLRAAGADNQNERRERLKAVLITEAERAYAEALGQHGPQGRMSRIYAHAIEAAVEDNNLHKLRHLAFMKRVPVTIDEFCDSPEFLGELQQIWPALRDDLRQMNPDIFTGAKPVKQALLGGATGTGKTTLSYVTNAYQAYLFECFNTPQRMYGMSPITPIVFMFQSVSQAVTKRVIYRPFKQMFLAMPFTQKWLNWDKRRETELIFNSGITIVPALANLESILGQAIAGAMQDEVNFMRIIENSKQVAGNRGQGGHFDQAREVYDNLARRQDRSFTTRGYRMGVLCVLSSTRYKSDFLDQRMEEVKKHDMEGIVCLRRKQYEVVPQDRFSGEKFQIVVGNEEFRTMVIEEHHKAGVDYPLSATIETLPVEYRDRFRVDPDGALRDVVGIASDAISPFITQRHKITESAVRFKERKIKPYSDDQDVDLATRGMPQWSGAAINANPSAKKLPHFAHIDLAISGDGCGVAVSRLEGFENRVCEESGSIERVPIITNVFTCIIRPSGTRQIDIAEVRRWVMLLTTYYEVNLYAITYDGFQSAESRQAIQKAGIRSWAVSMDRTTEPYEELRRAFYEDRLDVGDNPHLRTELTQLELNSEMQKVDHPPKGSKDASDALCGSVFAIRQSRLTRAEIAILDSDGKSVNKREDRVEAGPRPE